MHEALLEDKWWQVGEACGQDLAHGESTGLILLGSRENGVD